MPQSGVGSMQGCNEDYPPMKGHTRGGGTHPQCNPTNGHTCFFDKQTNQLNGHTEGGRTHNVSQRKDTHIFTGGGGRTHNVTQRTDTHIFTGGDTPTMLPNEWTHKLSV